MINKPNNLLELYEQYIEELSEDLSDETQQYRIRAVWQMLASPLLAGLGHKAIIPSSKPSSYVLNQIHHLLENYPPEVLFKGQELIAHGCEQLNRSEKVYRNAQRGLQILLQWCSLKVWWKGAVVSATETTDWRCPHSLNPSFKGRKEIKLTHHSTKKKYRLREQETSEKLRNELENFIEFLRAPYLPGRKIAPVQSEVTVANYIKDIRLMLGWLYHIETRELSSISLDSLIPAVDEEQFLEKDSKEGKGFWKQQRFQLNNLICKYFSFLDLETQAKSQQTYRSKLAALSALGKFQYRNCVHSSSDYGNIPTLQLIQDKLLDNYKKVKQDEQARIRVTDHDKKWPDSLEGKTALGMMQKIVLPKLCTSCFPKSRNNQRRPSSAISNSQQRFILAFFLTFMPARRQEDYRDLRIGLTCPVIRPPEVPLNGLYHPPLSDSIRERNPYSRTLKGNYLYKSYTYKNKKRKNGVWILEINEYKTQKLYGSQLIEIKDRVLEQGVRLYEIIEAYLYGIWLPGGRKNTIAYDEWWQPEFRKKRGRWVSSGRASLNPHDTCSLSSSFKSDNYSSWGYFFIQPLTGTHFGGSRFAEMFQVAVFDWIGKKTTPQTMRSMWATWAYQHQLNDRQRASLAYAMGHSLKMMEELYARVSPEEKRRPIEEAIDLHLFDEIAPDVSMPDSSPAKQVERKLKHLTRDERRKVLALLKINSRTNTSTKNNR